MGFNEAFEKVIMVEGGYSNHPYDPGGATKYGITEAVARANGYKGDMKDFPLDLAKKIYKKSYWDVNRLDEIKDENIANEIFDTGVNVGPRTALKFAQKAVNILSDNEIVVDGLIGPATLKAINGCKYPHDLFDLLNIIQGNYYIQLVEKNKKNKSFIKGWIRKRVSLDDYYRK